MHEFGITSSIVAAVLRAAAENNASVVARVDLVIGKLTFLNHEQVKLAYSILVKGTVLDGSCLNIEEVEGAIRCPSCGIENDIFTPPLQEHLEPLPLFSCLHCGGKVEIIRGKECALKGIIIES